MINIKGQNGKIVSNENKIIQRWRQYFSDLVGKHTRTIERDEINNRREVKLVKVDEVLEAI